VFVYIPNGVNGMAWQVTKSGRDFVIQVENRIYERTARDAQAKFGNVAKIRFTYQSTVGGDKRADRTPAILVTLK